MKSIKHILIILLFLFSTLYAGSEWRNFADYKIQVKLDDKNHFLTGKQSITYFNNSPDAISRIWLLLYPNAYKNENSAYAKQTRKMHYTKFHFSKEDERGYINIEKLLVNGKKQGLHFPADSIDLAFIELESPLSSGDSLSLQLDWKVKIPKIFSRFGHKACHYEMTQWYPKIPVYDEKGWHPYPYLNFGEFYYEFGDYNVEITLPENYIVGATGTLIYPQAEITWLDSLAEIGAEFLLLPKKEFNKRLKDIKKKAGENSEKTKTLHYLARNVVDFAWVADKDFFVQKGYYHYPEKKDRINIWNLYLPKSRECWENTIQTVQNTLEIYGEICGPYPYPNVWVVDGKLSAGRGMEYPMLTIINPVKIKFLMETVIAHEVGHNWFYGIMGFDEREIAWLDEGINSYAEHRYVEKYIPLEKQKLLPEQFNFILKNFNHLSMNRMMLSLSLDKNQDMPSNLSSEKYPPLNYQTSIYSKPPVGLRLIEHYVGRDSFDLAMNNFYEKWKFRHPKPIDMQRSFENTLDRDLNWFFEDFIKTTKKTDYEISDYSIKSSDSHYETNISIINNGELSTPVPINLYNDDEKIYERWEFPGEKDQYTIKTGSKPTKISIDPDMLSADINFRNNSNKYPLKFTPLLDLSLPNEYQVSFFPYPNYDYTNGIQTGLALMHYNIPAGKHNFLIDGAYGWKSKKMVGRVNYKNTYYDLIGREFSYGINVSSYTDKKLYGINLKVSQYPKFWGTYRNDLSMKLFYLDVIGKHLDPNYWQSCILKNAIISWDFSKNWFLSKLNSKVRFKFGHKNSGETESIDYGKISYEAKYRHRLTKNQRISTRIYFGSFLQHYENLPKQEYFYANGGVDPGFENPFIYDRSGNTFYSTMNNWYISDGINLKGYQGLKGNSRSAGLNLEYTYKMYMAFFDIGDVLDKNDSFNAKYDFGIGLKLGPVRIYLPIYLNQPVDEFEKISNFKALKKRWLIEVNLTKPKIGIG